jgi:hypothetical protein
VGCRSGDNILIEINEPIEGDVSGVDIQVIGLRGWVLGSHFFGMVVEILKGDPTICCKDRMFHTLSLTVAQALNAEIPTPSPTAKPRLEVNDEGLQLM